MYQLKSPLSCSFVMPDTHTAQTQTRTQIQTLALALAHHVVGDANNTREISAVSYGMDLTATCSQ